MASSTLPTRLRKIMTALSWSQSDLAAASGATRQTVSRWIKDGHITIAPEFAYALQDATGFSARWILLGEGHESIVEAEALDEFPGLRAELHRHIRAVVSILRQARGA